MLLAAGFAGGVWGADALSPPGWAALLLGWLGLGLVVAAWLQHRRRPVPASGDLLPRLGARTALVLLTGAAALGLARMGLQVQALERSALPAWHGRVVEVTARLATDPRPSGRGWEFIAKQVAVGSTGTSGRLAVRTSDPAGSALGDLVRLEAKIAKLDRTDGFDERLWRKQVTARATAVGDIEVLSVADGLLLGAANHFRERMHTTASGVLPEQRAGLLMGLVIGDDRFAGDRIRDSFRASGLSHLTAVSGANLAMVLAALTAVLTALRVSRRGRIVLGLAAIVLFAVVTRWEPSVLRASIMAALALAAFLFGRLPSPLNSLGLAFGGLLAFQPLLLWSIGFQLSFAATAGILLLRKPLLRHLRRVPRIAAEAVAIGVAAQVAVFPLIAAHFGRVSVAALPANLLAVALVPPATILGLAAGLLALVGPWLAIGPIRMAGVFVWGLESVAHLFGRSATAQLSLPNFGGVEALASYLAVAAVWLVLAGRLRWARWPAAVAMLLLSASFAVPALGHPPPAGDRLRATFFDVGAGDAALIETPEGARVLVDGGPDPEQVAAVLRKWGVDRIDLVVATHLHADHVEGLPRVLDSMQVGLAVFPGVVHPEFDWIRPPGWETALEGQVLRLGSLEIQVLGPGRDMRETAISALEIDPEDGTALNDASVVLKLVWGNGCILLPGDVEEMGQRDLLDAGADLDCAISKAPHHGSARLLAEFVERVDSEWAVFSVGPNRHGHPTDKALDLHRAAGARILRTDQGGPVVLELSHSGDVVRR